MLLELVRIWNLNLIASLDCGEDYECVYFDGNSKFRGFNKMIEMFGLVWFAAKGRAKVERETKD